MSRDLKPVEIYFLDQTHTQVFHEKGLRNLSVTWCVDGKKITEPLISPETKERYPELSFLFDEFKKIYEKHFIANVYWKYDNCTHWNFYGMDYIPQTPNEDINPGYYHICGSFFMTRWMIMFAFVRKVMNEILGDKTDDYEDSDKQLDKQLLKTYTIRKVE